MMISSEKAGKAMKDTKFSYSAGRKGVTMIPYSAKFVSVGWIIIVVVLQVDWSRTMSLNLRLALLCKQTKGSKLLKFWRSFFYLDGTI